jgi:hypothetical protein
MWIWSECFDQDWDQGSEVELIGRWVWPGVLGRQRGTWSVLLKVRAGYLVDKVVLGRHHRWCVGCTWSTKWSLVAIVAGTWRYLVDKVVLGRPCRRYIGILGRQSGPWSPLSMVSGGYLVNKVVPGRPCRKYVGTTWSAKWSLVAIVEGTWVVVGRQSGPWSPSSKVRGGYLVDKVVLGPRCRLYMGGNWSTKWSLVAVVDCMWGLLGRRRCPWPSSFEVPGGYMVDKVVLGRHCRCYVGDTWLAK